MLPLISPLTCLQVVIADMLDPWALVARKLEGGCGGGRGARGEDWSRRQDIVVTLACTSYIVCALCRAGMKKDVTKGSKHYWHVLSVCT